MNTTKKTKAGPMKIVRGPSGEVKIYKAADAFTIVYYVGTDRHRERRTKLDDAIERAKEILADHRTGAQHVRQLSAREIAVVDAAIESLREVSVPISTACREYADAIKLLDGRGTITEAVTLFLHEQGKQKLKPITVADLIERFIGAKKAAQMSDEYVRDVSRRLTRFGKAFRCNIGDIRTDEIQIWLDSIGATGRNFNNYRNSITTVFSFARSFNFLPREKKTEAELLRRTSDKTDEIQIYTHDEMRAILGAAEGDMLPVIALAGFAGLRVNEILQLDWSDIRLSAGYITISAAKAKTAQRRIVPILPNLAEWIAPHAKTEGRVSPAFKNLSNLSRLISATCKAGGVPMKPNALRHSFASYRLAVVQSADQVALEMGNSPQKLFTNYRQLVTAEDGVKWFTIAPQTPDNVVPMPIAV